MEPERRLAARARLAGVVLLVAALPSRSAAQVAATGLRGPLFAATGTPYQARGDARLAYNARTEAGSDIVAAGTAVFRATDAGKLIAIYGAGAGGGTLRATIRTVMGGTRARLSVPAAMTTLNARVVWGTDNRRAIQAALDDAGKAGGGVVSLGTGRFLVAEPLRDTVRGVWLAGAGPTSTILEYAGAGRAIEVTPPWSVDDNSGGIEGIRVAGNPRAAAGIYISNVIGFTVRDVIVEGFVGDSAAGIHLENRSWVDPRNRLHRLWTERTIIEDVWFNANTRNLRFSVAGGTESFGYTRIKNAKFNLNRNQVAFSLENDAHLYNALVIVNGNVDEAPATFYSLRDRATVEQTYFVHQAEGGGSWTLLDAPKGTTFDPIGFIANGAGTPIPPGIAATGTVNLSKVLVFSLGSADLDTHGRLRLSGAEVLGTDSAGGAKWGAGLLGGHTFYVDRGKRAWQIRPDGDLVSANGGELLAGRVAVGRGTHYEDHDSAIRLTNWGDGAEVSSVQGTDQALAFTVRAGRSPSKAPTVNIVFKDGPWGDSEADAPVYVCQRNDLSLPHGTPPHTVRANRTVLTLVFNGTPLAGTDYSFICLGLGR